MVYKSRSVNKKNSFDSTQQQDAPLLCVRLTEKTWSLGMYSGNICESTDCLCTKSTTGAIIFSPAAARQASLKPSRMLCPRHDKNDEKRLPQTEASSPQRATTLRRLPCSPGISRAACVQERTLGLLCS